MQPELVGVNAGAVALVVIEQAVVDEADRSRVGTGGQAADIAAGAEGMVSGISAVDVDFEGRTQVPIRHIQAALGDNVQNARSGGQPFGLGRERVHAVHLTVEENIGVGKQVDGDGVQIDAEQAERLAALELQGVGGDVSDSEIK